MLKTITKSSNKKLGDIASTYRAGAGSVYGTCPNSCPLKPAAQQGSGQIDGEYLQAVLDAVPQNGVSWTYTHFDHTDLPAPQVDKTTINISTDSYEHAAQALQAGHPVVIVRPSDESGKVDRVGGIRYVRCPAEYQDEVTCKSCGSGNPLCARQDRDYVIKFTAHGTGRKRVDTRVRITSDLVGIQGALPPDASGGCYASSGPVFLQWKRTQASDGQSSGTEPSAQRPSDAQVLREFVRQLPPGSFIRHHVAGDLG